jgi:hypothetical protein
MLKLILAIRLQIESNSYPRTSETRADVEAVNLTPWSRVLLEQLRLS